MTTNLTTWNYRQATLDAFGLEPEPYGDGRPDMEYGVTYVRQSICTICGSEAGPTRPSSSLSSTTSSTPSVT